MISKYQQRKRAYTNILMFIGLMAMAMVAWLDYKDRLPERRPSNTALSPIEHISFVNINSVRTELILEQGQWLLSQPVALEARNSRVGRLLELQSLDFSKGYPAESVNLEAAGLGEQARQLQLNENVYRFGQIEPISSKRYVQLEQRVLLVEDRYLPLIDGGINALAELKLPLQQTASAILGDAPIADSHLLAWQNTQAIGLRSASAPPATSLTLIFKGAALATWSAWTDKGLWVLQPHSSSYEYLISAAQAATLGLTH